MKLPRNERKESQKLFCGSYSGSSSSLSISIGNQIKADAKVAFRNSRKFKLLCTTIIESLLNSDEEDIDHILQDLDIDSLVKQDKYHIGFPKVISVKFTNLIAEIQMEHMGVSLK